MNTKARPMVMVALDQDELEALIDAVAGFRLGPYLTDLPAGEFLKTLQGKLTHAQRVAAR